MFNFESFKDYIFESEITIIYEYQPWSTVFYDEHVKNCTRTRPK